MKAEIGFVVDWSDENSPAFGKATSRLVMRVQSQSETESTMLQEFARRLGVRFQPCDGSVSIEELESPAPPPPPAKPPLAMEAWRAAWGLPP